MIEPALGPQPASRRDWNPTNPAARIGATRYEQRAAEVRRRWTAGRGHRGDRSAWEAFNALAEAVYQRPDLFPAHSAADGHASRTLAHIEGNLGHMKRVVFNALVRAAQPRDPGAVLDARQLYWPDGRRRI